MNVNFRVLEIIIYVLLPMISIAVGLVWWVIQAICFWKIFKKAGYAGWEAVVPIYNKYILAEMVLGNGWLSLLILVPYIGWVMELVLLYRLGKEFLMGTLFCLGLVLLPLIFLPILAFSNIGYCRKLYSGKGER